MNIDLKSVTEEELWKYVGKHLADNDFDAVLVGGAVVSIYTDGAYESGDLDFIIQNLIKDRLPDVMKKIGFIKTGKEYRHPDCSHLFVEFPSGPLGIGEDYNIKPREEKVEGCKLKILSPTDSIKDRLASFIYFNSQEGMDQAVLIARSQPFKKTSVKKWCEGEGKVEVYKEFIKKLKEYIKGT